MFNNVASYHCDNDDSDDNDYNKDACENNNSTKSNFDDGVNKDDLSCIKENVDYEDEFWRFKYYVVFIKYNKP